ncbi:unnamed protein product [Phaedon cochleariae]|uniref:SMP-30/Gluconolactonase/LRE-like region domain-containing protein n=1 Tax=Phaedon cochleariae TaxID=80249 RepID=A0A9P0DA66_PHACE|nr:unnamed protein product [Phaedon cochleariae]
MSIDIQITPISPPLDVGTRIHWDIATQSAIFVDIPNSDVYKYDENTGKVTKAKVGNEPLAFMFPVEGTNNKFIAGLGRKLVFVDWDGKSSQVSKVETIVEVEKEEELKGNRLNGAKVDPWGRLWAGTMGATNSDGSTVRGRGALYSLEKGKLKKHLGGIGISNGLAWDTQKMKMYYIDTLEPCVTQFDISNSGSLSNKKEVFSFKANNIGGLPDGLTIDSDGNLWVTAIYGSDLIKFNPENGSVLKKIVLPTPQVTSVSFGGKKIDKLFVTTARIPVDGKIPPDPAGTTYSIDLNDEIQHTIGYSGDRYIIS